MSYFIYAMVYLGSALMVFNIIGFIRFAQQIRKRKNWGSQNAILIVPVVLLVLFLAGYLAVGIFGKPDLIVSGILFGGSIFVFVMYLMLTKITERIVKAEHVEAEFEAAEASNRAKAEFLSTISHEMRTPMNVIIGLDTLALNEPDLSPDIRHKLEKIGESAKHLLDLINNILELNNADGQLIEVKQEAFSLSDALRQVNAIESTLCAQKGLTYIFDAPDRADGQYVGDVVKLKEILFALLDNAVKYTEAPGTVSLSLDAEPVDDTTRMVTMQIKDTGIGISEEFLPKIFDLFSKEDNTSTGSAGSGIGLAVTKRYVELLGGTIKAESEKNKGSLFTVRIPMVCRASAIPGKMPEVQDVSLEGKRILIVEDIPENAEIVADLLDLEGCTTDLAENGKIALDMFSASSPFTYDAILMDLRMPVMDGITATREIRALSREDAPIVPIIALSANAFENDVRQSLDAGMNAHLAKPSDAERLSQTLKRFIGEAESIRKDHFSSGVNI